MKEVLEPMLGAIRQIERRPCPYYSSYHIEELDVTLASGKQVPVIFKDMTLLEAARQVKPAFLYDPLREIEVYRDVLATQALGTAKFYGAVTDNGRHWLFLENVMGDLLWQVGDFAVWRAAARWLARLHRTPTASPRLLCYDGAYYRQWMERAAAFHPTAGDLAPAYERAVERLLQLPSTFIHGELYASNVLVQGNRICPIDWEMAALGPGLIDLAALSAGEWTEEQRADLARAYGGADPVALDACRLHLAVRWLGWSKEWTPPREHAQNWLQEARALAAKL
jgi:aminoglycoside phosphotransferase (APT) family kinase protein